MEIPYTDTMDYKLAIVMRKDLGMDKGKAVAQGAHAAVGCAIAQYSTNIYKYTDWYAEGQRKIVLKVDTLDELLNLVAEAEKEKIIVTLVKDAGRTQVEPGTITCIGIGPDKTEEIDKIIGNLKLL
jgi:peptidyl-tRNA hydrolase, PTH2 family